MQAHRGEVRGPRQQEPTAGGHAGAGVDRAVAADGGVQLRPPELGSHLQPGLQADAGRGSRREGGRGEREEAEHRAQHLREAPPGVAVPGGRQVLACRPLPPPQRPPPRQQRRASVLLRLPAECEPVVAEDIEPPVVAEGRGDAGLAAADDLKGFDSIYGDDHDDDDDHVCMLNTAIENTFACLISECTFFE